MSYLYFGVDSTRPEVQKHNYFDKLVRLQQQLRQSKGLYKIDVFHDDNCAVFSGGYCDCDPDIVVSELSED